MKRTPARPRPGLPASPLAGLLPCLLALFLALFLALLLTAAPAFAATPAGPQISLVEDPADNRLAPRVIATSQGFLALWEERAPRGDDPGASRRSQIWAQAFLPEGVPRQAPVPLTTDESTVRAVALLDARDGISYLALWVRVDANDPTRGRLLARTLRPGGSVLGGVTELGDFPLGNGPHDLPVASADLGRDEIVVAWSRPEPGSSAPNLLHDAVARRFRLGDGTPLGPEILLPSDPSEDQIATGVELAPDGSFVATWDGFAGEGLFGEVFARRFDASDQPLTDPVPVNRDPDFSASNQVFSSLARDPETGDHLVAWTSVGQDADLQNDPDPSDFPDTAIVARWLGPDLSAPDGSQGEEIAAEEFVVNVTAEGDQLAPSVAAAAGFAAVAWTGPATAEPVGGGEPRTGRAVFTRRVDRDGPAGPEVRVDLPPAAGPPGPGDGPGGDPGSPARFLARMTAVPQGGSMVVWSPELAIEGAPPSRAWARAFPDVDAPLPPPSVGTTPTALDGYRVWVEISPPTAPEDVVAGTPEVDCIAETACFSGALPGRSELFVRLIGPRPNGYFWVVLTRFTPSRVEVWLRQEATGWTNHYRLEAQTPDDDDLPGRTDRTGFLPVPVLVPVPVP